MTSKNNHKEAIFAGGCFWCTESDFDQLPGIIEVISGYTGGHVENPTYQEVSTGTTGHVEAVKITYNPDLISYEKLLDYYWRSIDPTDAGGQFADRGSQYLTRIYYYDEAQKKQAEMSKKELDHSGRYPSKIVTEILPAKTFYPAEEYHQEYYKKQPNHYKLYREGSGRNRYINKIWGK